MGDDQLSLFSNATLKGRIAESRDRLFRVAYAWCGDEMLADDLVQETMAISISKREQLRNEDRLFAWLYSILNSNWCAYLRKNRTHTELDDQLPSEGNGPMGHCQELELVNRVRNVVASLPVEQRQVISLVDLAELSYCEVAEALDVPIGTVMSRLHRARKNLLNKLDNPAVIPFRGNARIHLVE